MYIIQTRVPLEASKETFVCSVVGAKRFQVSNSAASNICVLLGAAASSCFAFPASDTCYQDVAAVYWQQMKVL